MRTTGGDHVGRVGKRSATGCVVLLLAGVANVFVLAATASAAPSRVQTSAATTSAGDTSLTVSWSTPTTPGDLLLLGVHVFWDSTASTITVPSGWVLAQQVDHPTANLAERLYYRENAGSQSGGVTVSTGASARIKAVLAEYGGIASSLSLDQTASALGSSSTPSSGTTAPTSQNSELWVALLANRASYEPCEPTNGFTKATSTYSGASHFALFDKTSLVSGAAGMSATIRTSSSCTEGPYSADWTGIVATFRASSGGPAPACSDGVDNDGDGKTDYPADPGCSSPQDTSEVDDVTTPCPPIQPGIVTCLTPGVEVARYTVQSVDVEPTGPARPVAGYVDAYRFTLAGVTVTLPCVALVIDDVVANPCAAAGGTFVGRTSTLVDNTVAEPEATPGTPVATVRVCTATLTATAFGFGVNSAPAYALC